MFNPKLMIFPSVAVKSLSCQMLHLMIDSTTGVIIGHQPKQYTVIIYNLWTPMILYNNTMKLWYLQPYKGNPSKSPYICIKFDSPPNRSQSNDPCTSFTILFILCYWHPGKKGEIFETKSRNIFSNPWRNHGTSPVYLAIHEWLFLWFSCEPGSINSLYWG